MTQHIFLKTSLETYIKIKWNFWVLQFYYLSNGYIAVIASFLQNRYGFGVLNKHTFVLTKYICICKPHTTPMYINLHKQHIISSIHDIRNSLFLSCKVFSLCCVIIYCYLSLIFHYVRVKGLYYNHMPYIRANFNATNF